MFSVDYWPLVSFVNCWEHLPIFSIDLFIKGIGSVFVFMSYDIKKLKSFIQIFSFYALPSAFNVTD